MRNFWNTAAIHVVAKHLHKGLFYAASPFVEAEMIDRGWISEKYTESMQMTKYCLAMAIDNCIVKINEVNLEWCGHVSCTWLHLCGQDQAAQVKY